MMKKLVLYLILILASSSSFSQVLKDKNVQTDKGFFNFFYEEKQDKIYLEVDKLEQAFLYVNILASSVGSNDIDLDRGQLGCTRLIRFIKAGNSKSFIWTK